MPRGLTTALPHGLAGVATATFLAVFAVQGFEVAPVPAAEVDQPRKSVPLAIIMSLAISAVVYVIVQTLVVGAHANLAAISDTPLADAALAVAPALGAIVVFGGLLSTRVSSPARRWARRATCTPRHSTDGCREASPPSTRNLPRHTWRFSRFDHRGLLRRHFRLPDVDRMVELDRGCSVPCRLCGGADLATARDAGRIVSRARRNLHAGRRHCDERLDPHPGKRG